MLNLLLLNQTPIFEQLQIEESLLRADSGNWCIINQGAPPAIVMGISGKFKELIHLDKLKQNPVPLIKRFSGGGTVFIDENTFFVTFIFNTSFLPIHPFPRHIMEWTENFYKPLFEDHPFHLIDNDYTFNQKKVGGNAQSIIKDRWLHHSTFLWDYNPENMEYLLIPKSTPAYRLGRSHTDFLCSLNEYLSEKSHFTKKLIVQLKSQFKVEEIQKENIEEILLRPHRKATVKVEIE